MSMGSLQFGLVPLSRVSPGSVGRRSTACDGNTVIDESTSPRRWAAATLWENDLPRDSGSSCRTQRWWSTHKPGPWRWLRLCSACWEPTSNSAKRVSNDDTLAGSDQHASGPISRSCTMGVVASMAGHQTASCLFLPCPSCD